MAEAAEGLNSAESGEVTAESPPAAPDGPRVEDGPRARLLELAEVLARGMNRKLLAEYLQLRRACR